MKKKNTKSQPKKTIRESESEGETMNLDSTKLTKIFFLETQ